MKRILPLIIIAVFVSVCSERKIKIQDKNKQMHKRIKLLIDTDANNELDDQHALAYAFLNREVFDIVGVTVNNTIKGEGIEGHYDEALRIIRLFNIEDKIPLKKGTTGTYSQIAPHIQEDGFDGFEAVNFIINEANKVHNEKLVLLPIGKLTNIALAILKAPAIKDKIRIVWLGSNYPYSGEYNLINDTTSVNPVIESGVDFEIVTVRYGRPSGTAEVTVTLDEIKTNMEGKGPISQHRITGRHGGEFSTFGDYSVNLFEHVGLHGCMNTRALFDMAAVAIVKNPDWAEKSKIPAPKLIDDGWINRPENPAKIYIWENFNREAIVYDFFHLMNQSTSR